MEYLEKKVYSSYAFTDNEEEKCLVNRNIYNELKNKYKIHNISFTCNKYSPKTNYPNVPTDDILNSNDIVYSGVPEYGATKYYIYKCPKELSLDEIALICDLGNLCFGYSGTRTCIRVSED